ncbi:hypothetical protein EDB19DRAFT_339402 [Suillus lakei]|nr:hypothetical protein EDB19DRAFT_339402 [Suillus lakei]
MISTTTMTRAARVALQGYLTAYFFKEIVIDRTIQVVSKSEKVSISLVTSTVCSSTAVLLLATAKAARQFLSDDFQRVPAPKDVDDTAGPNAPFAHENVADVISTTKAFGAPARPSSSRAVIESTEPTFDDPTKGLSTIDSDTTLIAYDEDLAKDVLSGDRAPDTTDLESFTDESTFYEEDCEAIPHSLTDDEPEHTSHAECDSHTIDNLIRIMSALSLDNVPSHISTISLANVPSHSSTYPLDDVPSHLSTYSRPRTLSGSINNSFSLDNVPLHLSTLRPHHTLHDHAIDTLPGPSQPSELRPTHSLHDHTIANLPGTLPLHNGSPQSSKCQLQRILVHDYLIDDLIRRMADLSLDEVPSQSSTLRPHHALHDHAFDTPPSNTKALALADNLAIDMLPNNADTLTLDDNHAINSLPKNAETLTLDNNHAIAIDALLQKPEAHTLDDNASQSSELQLQHTLYDNTNETLLHKMDTFSSTTVNLSHQNFSCSLPYTTTLSTCYYNKWTLFPSTMIPLGHKRSTSYTTILLTIDPITVSVLDTCTATLTTRRHHQHPTPNYQTSYSQ